MKQRSFGLRDLLVSVGVIALGMPETPTAKAAASFLSHFIHRSRDLEPLLSVMNAQGEFLVHHTLRFIGDFFRYFNFLLLSLACSSS